jgi:hypothetical protein
MPIEIYWAGRRVTTCDICRNPIADEFIDGATVRGMWMLMHPVCHGIFGQGLGKGRGQRFVKQQNGKFLRTEG